jgi:SAM-dependent methyltransferase
MCAMTDNAPGSTWTRYSTAHPFARDRTTDHVSLGPDVPSLDRRLFGDLRNKRVVDLGCGMGHGAVALARQGAKVIGVDPDAGQIVHARALADGHKVKVELHHADLADLAFCRSASVDLLVSTYALAGVEDLDRVFRQAHRVLTPDAPFVFSLPHPFTTLLHRAGDGSIRVARPTTSRLPLGDGPMLTYPHQFGDLHTSLTRANFRIDLLLEPEPDPRTQAYNPAAGWLPTTLVVRARKVGI